MHGFAIKHAVYRRASRSRDGFLQRMVMLESLRSLSLNLVSRDAPRCGCCCCGCGCCCAVRSSSYGFRRPCRSLELNAAPVHLSKIGICIQVGSNSVPLSHPLTGVLGPHDLKNKPQQWPTTLSSVYAGLVMYLVIRAPDFRPFSAEAEGTEK